MSDNPALEVAVKSASYNIVLQVLMRILSSVCNAAVLRFITKDALGVVNVRLMLLYSTCHFFSREAFRRSCLSKFDVYNFQKKCNLLWLCIPTCLLCSFVLGYIWLYWLENPDPQMVPDYSLGVVTVLVSVVIEMVAEPVYVFSQSYHFVKLKVLIEGLSLTLKSISMVIFLWLRPGNAVHAFCISQSLYSLIYCSAFYTYFWWYFRSSKDLISKLPIHNLKGLFPQFVNFFVDRQDLFLTWSFFKQTLLKQLLTEGERYVMTFFSVLSFAEQGLYDVVSNLGSLSARFIFLPIEDSGYLLFTQLLSRDKKANSIENLAKCLQILEKLLKLLLLLGFMILTFGYSYSRLLLLLYGGSSLSSSVAVTLLRWHCAYVLLLAVNGITECFKFAVMNNQQINSYNKSMVFFSCGFLFAAFCLAKVFGGVGFIIANCINMGLRIIHSMVFFSCGFLFAAFCLAKVFGGVGFIIANCINMGLHIIHSLCFINNYFNMYNFHLVWKIIPHRLVLFTLVLSICITSVSEAYFCCDQGFRIWIWHLSIGVCCFVIFIGSVILKERAVLKFIYDQWSRKKSTKKNS